MRHFNMGLFVGAILFVFNACVKSEQDATGAKVAFQIASTASRELSSAQTPAHYELSKIMLQTAVEGRPGNTTIDLSKASFATLVLTCSERMNSSACGNFSPASLKINAQKKGDSNSTELLSLSTSKKRFVAPSKEESLLRSKLRASVEGGLSTTPLDNGRLLVTVPIDSLVNSQKPEPVTLTISGSGDTKSSFTAALGKAGSGDAGCQKKSDCPSGQVCHYTHQCRDGECQGDSDCPSGHCHLYKCVECDEKSHCPAGQYCHEEGNEHKCKPGNCDMYGNNDCGCNEKCDSTTHNCVPADCNSLNLACKSNDCETGEKCTPGGTCHPDNWCSGNYDCKSKNCCISGTCQACGCGGNTDCGRKEFCNPTTNSCESGCWSDSQCAHCEKCGASHQCEAITVAGVKSDCPPGCDTPKGTCFTAEGTAGTCCEDHVCSITGCGEPLCPDGRVHCKGACCTESETCTIDGCKGPDTPPNPPSGGGDCETAGGTPVRAMFKCERDTTEAP